MCSARPSRLLAAALLLIAPGAVLSRDMTWDLLFNLSGAWHIHNGHVPHVDFLFVRADGEQLSAVSRLVQSGAIKPLVDKVFPLESVRDALAFSESGGRQEEW